MPANKKRIVVKVGSNVLTRPDGMVDVTNMSALVDQIAALHHKGHSIVLVSSGAVACGRGAFDPPKSLDPVAARQIYSSIGQIRLINFYNQLFAQYGITIGQVLTQKDNFASRTAYLNQRGCMLAMLQNGLIPVVNENDTASLTELMFTDNDEMSGMIATMLDADMLVILSNIDGLYTGAPGTEGAQLIKTVSPGDDPTGHVAQTKSRAGRGGMGTKCGIAQKVSAEGIAVVIARGNRPHVLTDLIDNPRTVPHTLFIPAAQPLNAVKRWIAHSTSFAKGTITVNSRAADIIAGDTAVSLLPIGVTGTQGDWDEGDIIAVARPDGQRIAVGRAATDAATARNAAGKRGEKPLIHCDYLYLL